MLLDSVFLNYSITVLFLRIVYGMKIGVVSPHAVLGRKKILISFGMVYVDIIELYLKKKLHCTDFLHY